jgi:hypothetical protein
MIKSVTLQTSLALAPAGHFALELIPLKAAALNILGQNPFKIFFRTFLVELFAARIRASVAPFMPAPSHEAKQGQVGAPIFATP